MKIFTFNDSFRNKNNRTKKRMGLVSFLLLFLGLGSYAQDSCEISVTVSSEGYGEVTTWQLLDGFGQAVLSGGIYSYNYSDTKTYMALNPPYSLKIMIEDYCWNNPSYSVTVGGQQDISGTIMDCGPINVVIPLEADLTPCFPPCPAPQQMINGVSHNSASLYWISEGTSFDLEWGESGFILGQGTLLTGIGTSHILNNLDSETYYQYYVKRNCGIDGYSIWSGPYTFYTGYCLTFSTYDGMGFSDFTTSEGYTNIVNLNNGVDSSYSDFTSYNVTQSPGGSFNYEFITDLDAVEIWIDWNNNFIFEENELVAEHESGETTGTVIIPEGIPEGDYRMRLRSRFTFLNSTASPCGEYAAGETEDYTISVIPVPVCPKPSGANTTYVGVEFVDIEWISNGTAFEIEYGFPDFIIGEGINTINATGTSGTITGLTQSTDYQYYIRQNCNDDGYSFWAGPYIFTTATPGQIGGGVSSSNHFPIRSCSKYNYSQQIYLANEIDAVLVEGATLITAIRFKPLSVSAPQNSEKWTVYLGNTIKSEFINTTDWIPYSDLEQVFSGQLSFIAEEWVEINLNTPFIWDGTSNLVVSIYEETETNSCVANWAAFNTGSNRGILYYGGSNPNPYSPPIANYGVSTNIAQMQVEAIELPLCIPPVKLEAIATFSSADLLWTSSGSSFDIEWGESDFIIGQGTMLTNINQASHTLTNLDSETYYQYYVRKNCGADGYSTWSGPYTFYTEYCSASSTNTENRILGFFTSQAYINILNSNNGTDDGYSDFTDKTVVYSAGNSFNYSVNVPGGTTVEIWIDYDNNLLFEENELVAAHNEPVWTDLPFTGTIAIPDNLTNGDYRIRIRSHSYYSTIINPCGNMSEGETEDYTLSIIPVPSCLFPTELTVTGVSHTSAELSWVSDGTSFNVEYGGLGFIPGEGITISDEISSTSYLLTGLTAETSYEYYVRQDCGEGEVSFWAGPFSFYTGYCLASSDNAGNTGVTINGFSTSEGYINIFNPNNGFNNTYNNFTNHIITQSAGGSFDYEISVWENTNVDIWIDWNNNFLFEENELVANHDDDVILEYIPGGAVFMGTIAISDNLLNGDYRMRVRSRFYVNSANPCGNVNLGETEDYTLKIIPVPSCIPPHTFSENVIALNSTEIYWMSNGDTFEVEYGLQGFTLGSGMLVTNIETTSVILSNLNADTHYDYYVRRNCETDGYSLWSESHTFFTGYCDAFSTAAGQHITSFITTGGISDNISNSTEGSTTGYNYYNDMAVSHYETGSVSFSATTTQWSNMGLSIWIDWNSNLEFEESEQIYDSGTTQTSFTGSITVPFGTPVGDYRMRVRTRPNNTGINTNLFPCGTLGYGETEDYIFKVIGSPTCLAPFMPTSVNTSATSTSLSWLSGGDVFDIKYGYEGFEQGEEIEIIEEINNNYAVSGLIPGVNYEYYVRQNCVNNEYSEWVGPVIFTFGSYEGNIPTMFNSNPQLSDDACATTPFSLEVPAGYYLAALNVKYTMSSSFSQMTQIAWQRSVIFSPTLGIGESEIATGDPAFAFPGTYDYNRNITFANGSTGTIEFELKAWRTQGGTGCGIEHIYVMDGSWTLLPTFLPIPTCPAPTDLDITNITENSVDITWADNESSLFDVQWGETGFNQNTEGNLVTGLTNNFYSILDLNSSNTYEFYVRKNCSSEEGEDYSVWTGPFKFNSGYCIPTSTQAYYFTLFNTTNALENLSFSYPSGSPLGTGYKNETDMIVSQEAGSSFNFSANYIGGASGFKIWIDWNNNFVFEDNEQVFYQGSTTGNKTGSITIPSEIEPGNYRMRIRVQAGANSTPSACGNIDTGEAIDFTLNVSCNEVTPPIGNTIQDFEEGDTLANLDITGNNLVWYADSELSEILEETTLLVDATTYYVVSVEGNCQSDVLDVTVNEVLSTSDFTKFGFGYHPNPVSEILYLRSNTEISEVTVFNMLGQKLSLPVQSNNTQINMTELPSGNYIMNVTIEGVTKTFKIVK